MPAAPPNSLKNKPIIPLSQLTHTHFRNFHFSFSYHSITILLHCNKFPSDPQQRTSMSACAAAAVAARKEVGVVCMRRIDLDVSLFDRMWEAFAAVEMNEEMDGWDFVW
ncbi:hypothetical protein Patl1_11597 [Pistacia atlantica]|uniref:Uncharacterized protein n=1 Tax=Pistacia atlantica TaxID=434234 RepID=A0ACC1A8V5_9ROSI|nr:hypothetical protein Patl1_11597 [Pistacia atlantica]